MTTERGGIAGRPNAAADREQGLDAGGLARRLYATADATRGLGLPALLHPECEMHFNGSGPTVGRSAVVALVAARHAEYQSITHRLHNVIVADAGRHAVVETEVTYHSKSGGEALLRGCSILEFDDGLLRAWRVYVDPTALAGAPGAK